MPLLPPLHEILALWRQQGFDPAYRNLLLAVSGGADSVALLHYFAREVRPFTGCTLHALHVQHGLRPATSAEADADFTVNLGHQYDVPVAITRLNPALRKPSESIEAWARRERYAALQTQAAEKNCAFILTAHHRDDHVETMALRLLRGEGWQALTGMAFMRSPGIVRPFLLVPGANLRAYLKAHAQNWREDTTNNDLNFLRNRLRHHILHPVFPEDAPSSPSSPRDRLFAASQTLRQLAPWLEILEPQAPHFFGTTPFWHYADLAEPLAQGDTPLVLKRLRALVQAVQGPQGWPKKPFLHGFKLDWPLQPDFFLRTTGWVRFFGDWQITQNFSLRLQSPSPETENQAYFTVVRTGAPTAQAQTGGQSKANPKPVLESSGFEFPRFEFPLSHLPQTLSFEIAGKGYRLTVQPIEQPKVHPMVRGPFPAAQEMRAVCDARAFSSTLLIRTRQAGDRFSPLGIRSQSRKLNTYFNEHRVPAEKRNALPLVLSNGRVVWIPGYALSEWVKVVPESELLYELVLESLP